MPNQDKLARLARASYMETCLGFLQGGVLTDEKDWIIPNQDKLARLARINPNPTRLEVNGNGDLLRVVAGSTSTPAPAPVAHPRHVPIQPLSETPVEARAPLLRSSCVPITHAE